MFCDTDHYQVRFLSEWRILYGIVGIVSLVVVVVVGKSDYGAMLGFTVAGIGYLAIRTW